MENSFSGVICAIKPIILLLVSWTTSTNIILKSFMMLQHASVKPIIEFQISTRFIIVARPSGIDQLTAKAVNKASLLL
jgi:hypothetical protein